MAKAYRIVDWNENYEKAQLRKCKRATWVAAPNVFDTAGYGNLMTDPDAEMIYGVWNALMRLASRMPTRGLLVNGKPLTYEDIAVRTRMRADRVKLAIQVLKKPEIGWLEQIEL